MVISIWIFYEAYQRLQDPPQILGGGVLVVAIIGLIVNLAAAGILMRSQGESLNVSAAFRHVLADLAGSIGVIAAALIILLTGWRYADHAAGRPRVRRRARGARAARAAPSAAQHLGRPANEPWLSFLRPPGTPVWLTGAAPTQSIAASGLHGLEAQLMEELWRLEEASVHDVMQAINAREAKQRAYTTFLTTADRLRIKRFLKRRRKGKTDLYAPVMPRDAYLEARSRAGADALVDQFGDRARAHFRSAHRPVGLATAASPAQARKG